jgi:uncharacterized membrane protein
MKTRKILSQIIGLIQAAIGGVAIVFAFLTVNNVFDIQTMLGATEAVGFYFSVFLIVGILSIISGIFLFYDQTRGRNYD